MNPDQLRETIIASYGKLVEHYHSVDDNVNERQCWNKLVSEIKCRSPEQITRMEIERGIYRA